MRNWKYLGFISIGIFWLFTGVSIHFNPWFSISQYTFSKLGRTSSANYPWIFSMGTIIGGIFMIWYGVELVKNHVKKLQILGGGYVVLSGVFMILIGVFPDGTKPHDFIAVATFLSFYVGLMLFGLGNDKKIFKVSTVFIFILALAGLLCPCWPSLCYLEIYGLTLAVLDMISLLIFAQYK